MRTRALTGFVLAAALALPTVAAGLDRGNVVLKIRTAIPPANTPGFDLWLHFGWTYAGALGMLPE